MKTVFALIDHPNLDIIIGPVLVRLREKGVQPKVLVTNAGKANHLISTNIPYQTKMNIEKEFLNIEGQKLFLNAADQNFPAHELGRKIDTVCRMRGIPSLTIEHGTFFKIHDWNESYVFNADKMAIIGETEYEEFRKLGVPSEKLVITGFPPFDEFFEFLQGKTFMKGKYIWIAGQNHTFISENKYYTPAEFTNLLREMYSILLSKFPDLDILIKPHPAEPFHNTVRIYTDAIEPEFHSKIQIVDSKSPNIQGIFNSAFVVSFSPSVLFESIILKKSVIGITIERLSECLSDAKNFGAIILETSPENIASDIYNGFPNLISGIQEKIDHELPVPESYLQKYLHRFDGKASERVADVILQMMEDNKRMALQDTTGMNRPIFGEIGFERYQRLMGIAEEAIIEGHTPYTVLDIGSHDNAFKKFVPGADYFSYNGFISKTQKTFYKDSSFDVVIAADVLEHVKPEDRKAFLLELIRLAKKKVVFSFPSEGAADFERFVLTIIPDHKWLQEHVENGLPNRCEIENILNEIGVLYQTKPNHSLASWVYSVIFDHSNFDQKLKQRINEFLQKRCFEMENNEPAYRYIYTVTIPQNLDRKRILQDHAISTGEGESPLVSIIIPVFNKVGYTQRCLETLLRNTRRGLYEVIIIDNASTDGTKNLLERLASEFKIIVNDKNIGFAGACNQGAQAASAEYLLFLNNDTEPKSGWLDPLLEILDNDETVAAAGSKLLFPDNTIQHAGVVIFNDKKLPDPLVARHIYYKQQSDLPEASQKRTYQALTAACLLIRKSAFYQVDGFDEGYWNGYEDIDLCFKLRDKGWNLVYQHESVLIHHESKSGPERFSKTDRNIERLHSKWLGKIEPDFTIETDGSIKPTGAGKIKSYSLPNTSHQKSSMKSIMTKTSLTSIIILTFNQLKYTKECVESIRKHTPEPHEIIFVDNGSTDGTVKWLRKLLKENPYYKLIENHKNLGFSKGCNQGINASSGEYILLLNNDVVVTNGWLSGMLECLNSAPDIGVVGPMTNNISGNQKVEDTGYQSMADLNVFAQSFRERNRHRRVPSRRIVGFCMLFRRELVEKIGLLDETFGTGNFEDDDFCLRAALEGYKNFIAGDIFIHHYGSMSFRGNRMDYSSAMTGNRKIFKEKWSGIERKSSLGGKVLILSALEYADTWEQKGKVDVAAEMLLEGIRHAPTEKRLYYALSEILIDAKQFKDAHEMLKEMSLDESDLRRLELIGYCAEGMERYDEAEEYVGRVLSLNPTSALALNLKGILAHKKGDNEKAQEFFQKAIKADPGFGEPYTNSGVLKWAAGQREEALDLLERGCILSPTVSDIVTSYHSAISTLVRFERAEKVFREAQAIYPLNRKITFLLIDTLIQQGKNDIAMKEIEKAMVTFGTEEGILSAALKIRETLGPRKIEGQQYSRVTLSLCMIVKNEEAYIAQCLTSVAPVIDEMIIVDTGSTDRTKDIAQAFGAQVYDFEWTYNFAEARNFSLAQAHGDWVLVLDADEVISSRDHAALTELIKKQKPVGYSFTTRNYTGNVNTEGWVPNDGKYHTEEAADGWFPSQKVRLFPRDPRIRFENHVHELVEPSLRKEKIEIEECRIPVHHYGRLDRKRDTVKEKAYYELGKAKLQEKGDDVKALSELAVTAGTVGKYEEAIELWQRAIAIKPDFVKAFVNLGYVYLQLQRYEDALAVSKRAVELAPDQKETVLNYASAEVHAGNVKKAISVLEHLLNKIPEFPPAIGVLAAAYCIEGEKEKGLAYIEKIKKLGFNCPEFLYKHARSLTSAGRAHYAIRLLEAAVESNHVNNDITLLLSELQSGNGCERLA